MRLTLRSALAAIVAMGVAGGVAHANGRPPLTNGIYFKPGDPHSLYVRTTFGLLISHDDGCTMNWICETDMGYGGPFDPKVAIANDGTIFLTTFQGLRISRDGGCGFTTIDSGQWIDSLDISSTGQIFIR